MREINQSIENSLVLILGAFEFLYSFEFCDCNIIFDYIM